MKNNNMLYIKEVELAREIWFRSIKQSEEWLDITVSKNDKVVEIEINSRKI